MTYQELSERADEQRDVRTMEREADATSRARFSEPRSEVEKELAAARLMVTHFYWLTKDGGYTHTHEKRGDDCWGCRAANLLKYAQEKGYVR